MDKIIDPKLIKKMNLQKNYDKEVLSHQDKFCLLSLLSKNPFRNKSNYKKELYNTTGKNISISTIDRFFKNGLPHKASLRKPVHVPLDKWKAENIIRLKIFELKIQQLPHYQMITWIDEKHMVIKDTLSKK